MPESNQPDTSGRGEEAWLPRKPLDRRSFLAGATTLASAGLASSVLAACGASPKPKTTATSTPKAAAFPIGAAARASGKPVGITLWHSMQSANLEALTTMTDQFNASQGDVRVALVNQNSYPDTLSLYTAALAGGNLPDVVQIESEDLQLMIDTRSVVPAQSAIDADHYDLSDFLGVTVSYFRVGSTLWAMPFNISSQVLYYDQNAFTHAGLDPSKPPTTLDGLRGAANKIVQAKVAKYGMALKLSPSTFDEWLAMGGGTLVNNSNGRQGRATKVTFDSSLGKSIIGFYAQMFSSHLAQPTSATTYDNLFAIGNGISPMTLETSAALGTVAGLLGGYKQVKLGVGPMPGPTGNGGVYVGGAGLYMVSKSPPERQDGAWQYIKYLIAPAQQAAWAAASGYVPVRKSAVDIPVLKARWASLPGFRVAYDQILSSPVTAATAGAVMGPASQIDTAIQDALSSVSQGRPAAASLAQAAATANQALSSYNSRVQG